MLPDIIRRFAQVAEHQAALLAYPFPDRRQAWLDRLQLNLAELQFLDALSEAGGAQYQPPQAGVRAKGIAPQDDTEGIAAIAAAARRDPAGVQKPALQALQAARAHSGLHAFIDLATEPQVAEQAQAALHGFHEGRPAPLFAVPIAVKDLMSVQGFRLTGGSGGEAGVESADALAIGRLRSAGAIIMGTTNLHELAYGITSNNPHFSPVVNPRSAAHIPGGSSGGSAAAVAAGIVRASVGTDTAGSIRIPAACCGVVGFKPTYDAIPRQGAMDLGPTLDHLGPITQSVDDAALLFSVMAGMPAQVPERLADLQGVRVGIPRRYFFDPLAPDVARALDAAIARLRADGADITDVDLPGVQNASALQFATLCSEATAIHWSRLLTRPHTLGEDVRVRLEIGQLFPAVWYTRAQGARKALAQSFQAAMQGADVLLIPTLRTTAPPNGAQFLRVGATEMPLHAAVTSLTLPFNLTGMPAISLPCGAGDNGLPVGLQLAAPHNQDWRLLAVARRTETLLKDSNP
ncbi:amidase [Parapusillimonas granuli]|uniref:amidase n=1 Tax=Parapusillimonas granuli TaxID=380911 RepID=UPI0017FC5497|nr:aspartyl-tRNA(Asn)/glutamyl-tRNA(Gln) amidotransferase subunit A [Parapusillimonas granuli]